MGRTASLCRATYLARSIEGRRVPWHVIEEAKSFSSLSLEIWSISSLMHSILRFGGQAVR